MAGSKGRTNYSRTKTENLSRQLAREAREIVTDIAQNHALRPEIYHAGEPINDPAIEAHNAFNARMVAKHQAQLEAEARNYASDYEWGSEVFPAYPTPKATPRTAIPEYGHERHVPPARLVAALDMMQSLEDALAKVKPIDLLNPAVDIPAKDAFTDPDADVSLVDIALGKHDKPNAKDIQPAVGMIFNRTANTVKGDREVVIWQTPHTETYSIQSIDERGFVIAVRLGDLAVLTFHKDNFQAVSR